MVRSRVHVHASGAGVARRCDSACPYLMSSSHREYWALDPDHVHLLFMLAVFAPRWLVAYLLYSAPKSGILSRCFAADAWPTALYSAGTYLVPILWLMSPHMARRVVPPSACCLDKPQRACTRCRF